MNEECSTIHMEKARQFYLDDCILVHRCKLQVKTGNNQSFTREWRWPYKVLTSIGSHACRLKVPDGTHWHNIVHITLRKPFRMQDKPQDVDENEAEVVEVEQIVYTEHAIELYHNECLGQTVQSLKIHGKL